MKLLNLMLVLLGVVFILNAIVRPFYVLRVMTATVGSDGKRDYQSYYGRLQA